MSNTYTFRTGISCQYRINTQYNSDATPKTNFNKQITKHTTLYVTKKNHRVTVEREPKGTRIRTVIKKQIING